MNAIPSFVRRWAACALVAVLCPGVATPLLASGAAALDGQVLRAGSDHPVAGATIHLSERRSGASRSSTPTGTDGRFRLPDLPPGTYDVGVEADGGLYVLHVPVVLAPGASRFLDLEIAARADGPQPEPNPAPDPKGRFARKMSILDNPLTAALIVLGSAVAIGEVYDAAFNNDNDRTPSPSAAN